MWGKTIFNGFIAWIIGIALYMIPSLVVALRMGFELGPQLNDSAEVSRQISQHISEMYRSNLYLAVLYIVLVALLVFWRAARLKKISGAKAMVNGAIVGAVPAAISLLSMILGTFGWMSVIEIFVFLAAGIVGGMSKRKVIV